MAKYTEQQRQINSALRSRSDYDLNSYYIILTNKKPSTKNEKGLMPLGRQFGYVYDGNIHTIAHELGHGAFSLRHPFSEHGYRKRGTDWLMDYSSKYKIPYSHWQAINDPKLRLGIFDGDEEGEIVEEHIFDKEELKKYNSHINTLKNLNIFKFIYDYVDKSDKYITVSSLKANFKNLEKLKENHEYTNGYFKDATKKEEKTMFWGLVKLDDGDPGIQRNPHKIVLFSSKNFNLTQGEVRGDGFKNAHTIFEEFFHAAHFLYLKENGKYTSEAKFRTQTETEVELAQAFASYLMTLDTTGIFNNVNTNSFDNYSIVRAGDVTELDTETTKIFDRIIKNKKCTSEDIDALTTKITNCISDKKKKYSDIKYNHLDWNLDFFRYVIKNTLK